MAITKAKKVGILAQLTEVKDTADSIVFVHYKGLSVADTTAMRKELREKGVGMFVAKKTLMKRAFDGAYTGEMPVLDGEIAVAYSADPMAPAQNMKEFSTKFKEKVTIEGGIFQGVYKTKVEMIEIASIPALPVLHGMFANFLQQPVQQIAMAIQAVGEAKQTA